MTQDGLSRRHALTGAAAVGLGVPLLAACGDDSSTPGGATPTTAAGESGDILAATSEIEVGSGVIFSDERVVVTQPTEGEFKAFSSVCTHQGCPVSEIVGSEIRCKCHNSAYSIEDGSVVGGPAPRPLASIEITVEGDEITLA